MGPVVQNRMRTGWWGGFSADDLRSLAICLLWLAIINCFALIVYTRLDLFPDLAFSWIGGEEGRVAKNWDLINLHKRWDSYWYLDIASKGYYTRGAEGLSNVVFFPLYPFLIYLVGWLTGGHLVLAGWLVSTLFLLLAAVQLTRLVQEWHPQIEPTLPLIFLLAAPPAFFLNAVYSESLFLFLILQATRHALAGRFLAASLWTALSTATRVAGCFFCLLLLVEFIRQRGWRRLFSWEVAPLALAPLGIAAFFSYHYLAFGDFFLFFHVQDNFGRDFSFNWRDYLPENHQDLANTILDMATFAWALLLTALVLWRLRLSYGLYMLFSLGVAISSGTVLGVSRYTMMLFPIYILAASVRSPLWRGAWLFTSVLLLALDVIRFVNFYWTS